MMKAGVTAVLFPINGMKMMLNILSSGTFCNGAFGIFE
jgi:hypothetical protein